MKTKELEKKLEDETRKLALTIEKKSSDIKKLKEQNKEWAALKITHSSENTP